MADEQEIPRALTLTNLLLVMSFIVAFQSVFMEVHSRQKTWGGVATAIALGMLWAIASGYAEWQLLSRLVKWIKSTTLLNVSGISVLVIWPILVGFTGIELVIFIDKLFTR